MFFKQKLFYISTIIVTIAISLYLAKSIYIKTNIQKPIKTNLKQKKETAEIIIKNFDLKDTDNSNQKWEIFAEIAKIFRKTNTIVCKKNSCILRNKTNEIAKLNSNKSLIDKNKKTLQLKGNINGNYNDLKIKGHDINYNYSKEIIKTKNNLEYLYQNFRLTAKESHINLRTNIIKMKNGITCEITN